MDLADQLIVVHEVASQYWLQDSVQIASNLIKIDILKRTGGKVAGILPAFRDFPSVFFKVYFYDRGFRFETAGLQAAANLPSVNGVRVPEVIAIMPKFKAILMEKRAWDDTSSTWNRFWVISSGIDWKKVGSWLRAFHDSQVTHEKNEYFLRKKFEKFESHLKALEHLFTLNQLQKMNLIYRSAREYFEENKCEWVISHGDLGLANIKRSGSMLEIIDFEDCQLAPREFDFLNCFSRMDQMKRLPFGRTRYQQIRKNFFTGYGLFPQNSAGFNFLYLLIKLDMLEIYSRRQKEISIGRGQKALFHVFQVDCFAQINKYLSRYQG